MLLGAEKTHKSLKTPPASHSSCSSPLAKCNLQKIAFRRNGVDSWFFGCLQKCHRHSLGHTPKQLRESRRSKVDAMVHPGKFTRKTPNPALQCPASALMNKAQTGDAFREMLEPVPRP